MRHAWLIFSLFFVWGCFEEDTPVPPYQSPPGVSVMTIPMGPLYDTQIFVDLGTESIVKTVSRDAWDLAFDARPGMWEIHLNSARFMRALAVEGQSFENVTSVAAGAPWQTDAPTAAPDSMALRDWADLSTGTPNVRNVVFVLDLGFTPQGNTMGRKKIQIQSVDEEGYVVRMANLNNTQDTLLNVLRTPDRSFSYLKIHADNPFPDIEPASASWDLVFTQYTGRVLNTSTGIYEEYSVNGVLINPYEVEVARDFTTPFSDILFSDIPNYTFTRVRDVIGYDWKTYSFDTESYVVEVNRVFIIRDTGGLYYKMRFIGFVNDAGVRGYPKFELARF
jgi:hypothetical protein